MELNYRPFERMVSDPLAASHAPSWRWPLWRGYEFRSLRLMTSVEAAAPLREAWRTDLEEILRAL